MSKVNVTAIEPFNHHAPGATFELSEHEAGQAVAAGLVKIAGPVGQKMAEPLQNKMRAEPENKGNPSPAAGEARPSSASQAAPASAKTTAKRSAAGTSAARKTARSR